MENTMAGAPIWRRASAVLNGKPSGRRVELDVYITPGQAQQMLDTSLGNRQIRKKDLEMYQALLLNDQWINTGEPIIMSEPTDKSFIGHLLDGHTRLTACVNSGVGFRSDILFGQAVESFGRMNCDARTVRDYLHIRGVKNIHKLSAAYNAVSGYKNRSMSGSKNEHTITSRVKVYEWIEEHFPTNEIPDYVKLSTSGLNNTGHLFAGLFLIREANPSPRAKQMVDEFIESLCTGVGLSHADPVLTLRNTVIRKNLASRGASIIQRNMFAVIRAWNAYVSGERLSKLYFSETNPYLMPLSFDQRNNAE